jgi:hypothetical protein
LDPGRDSVEDVLVRAYIEELLPDILEVMRVEVVFQPGRGSRRRTRRC